MFSMKSELTKARVSDMKVVRSALLRLSQISDAASEWNHIYGAIIFWWYADLTASFPLGIPSCILAVCGGAQLSEYEFSLVDLVRDMAVFMMMTFVASEIAKNVADSLHYALRGTNTVEDRHVDMNFALLLKNLICCLPHPRRKSGGFRR
ncbi:hypothetical protein HPB51_026449 [Rhipicephalus microplus]|uniref:Uncharacterized protein n=1 Tax=Rhipicephalus microplus TaxID=6941 RepID=A0A9J6D314_RHIMP|nr:hypothetical protein HPB51_026449 [Rhipicephalus microplus]